MHLHSPASYDDAIALVESTRPTFDTPGQRDLLGRASLERTRAQRHPDLDGPPLVWAAVDGARTLGLVGGRRIGSLALVDLVAMPDDADAATLVVDAATAWARTHDEAEVSFETPVSDEPLDEPRTAAIVARFASAGWHVLVTRRHFHLHGEALDAAVTTSSSSRLPTGVTLERAREGDGDRLATLLERVVVGSLDERDRATVAEHGVAGAARLLADELVEADPIDCLRLATAAGADVGIASWRTMPDGRGYVLHIGVAVEHRGRGLASALAAATTRALHDEGAAPIIADTDDANVPMRRAFARAGWQPTACRIDLTLAT